MSRPSGSGLRPSPSGFRRHSLTSWTVIVFCNPTGTSKKSTANMLGDDPFVRVRFGSRRVKKRVEHSKQLLLREFAERFDRTFLPTVEVVVP